MAAARGFRAIAAKAACWQRAAFALRRCERCFYSGLGEGLVFSCIISSALRRNIIGG